MPDFILGQHIHGTIRKRHLINRLPLAVQLRFHTARIYRKKLHHFPQCLYLVGVKITPQTQADDNQFPEFLRRHVVIGFCRNQLMQPFIHRPCFKGAADFVETAGQHTNRLSQHPDAGIHRRQPHGPLAADPLSGIGVV